MRNMVLVAVFGLVLFGADGAAGQETSHYLTPAGFYLPSLQQGEYLVTAEWNFWRQDLQLHYDETPGIDDEYGYRDMNVIWKSACALTNRLLVGASVTYYPPQDRYRQRFWNRYDPGDLSVISYNERQTHQVVPEVIMAYRPRTNLELHCLLNYHSADYDYTFAPLSSNPERNSGSMAGYAIMVGLAYHGKL